MLGFVSSQIADCLYTSIMTDTGNFSFTNTSSNTFEIAAELLRFGAKPAELNTLVYRNVPLAKTKLLGFALSTFELKRNDRIAISVITQQDLQRYNAKGDYAEGIIDHLRDIETVEIAILMRECQDGSYKVGLRSKGESDVAALAQNFGGGGHNAAGFKTDMPFETRFVMVVSAAIEALSINVRRVLNIRLAGPAASNVVQDVPKALSIKRVGHAGTLDRELAAFAYLVEPKSCSITW